MMKRRAAWLIGAALSGLGWAAPLSADMPEPGKAYFVSPENLPQPGATASVANPSRIVARPSPAPLKLPPGFKANLFADGLTNARWLAVSPEGWVVLAQPRLGRVVLLTDHDGDGRADGAPTILAQGLDRPHGLAFDAKTLYIGDTDSIWRLAWPPGRDSRPEPVTPEGAISDGSGHWTRNLALSPEGGRIFVAIGSRTNIGRDESPRATVLSFGLDGSSGQVVASGLRNPVGLCFRPGTTELWTVVNERDGLGDGLVPDYLARIDNGGFFGWPYSYIGRHPQPGYETLGGGRIAVAKTPDLLFRAHSAPLGLVFYDGNQFPPEYRGDAFVALHGSWNSSRAEGYMVARVPFRDGRPAGGYEAFLTGFLISDRTRIEAWGRPVGLAVAKDGSLLVADDASHAVWRISYHP